jgi:hypothetical protein
MQWAYYFYSPWVSSDGLPVVATTVTGSGSGSYQIAIGIAREK